MMSCLPINGGQILRGVEAHGPLEAEPDHRSLWVRADLYKGVTWGGRALIASCQILYSDHFFDRYVQMQRVFDDAFVLHDMMYMDCTNIFEIYIHDMILMTLYVYGCM